jgi:nanoRNase/pAp phosphatase (c-di-AMP/oligoRNAs hydrolase)
VIDVTASSNGELLQNVFMLEQGAAPIQPEVATWLLASIVAATNSFQDVRTTPRTLAASAKLIELGARQQDIIVSLFKTRDFALLKLWGRVLARIKTVSDQFLYSTLSSTDFTKTNTTAVHVLPALRELLDNISGYQVVVLLAETEPGSMTAVLATLPHVQTREFVGILASGEIREVQNHGAYRVQQFAIAAKDIVEAESKVVAAAPELNQK